MVKYCPRHSIGYNDELDGSCPQCGLAHQDPPEPLDEDPRRTQQELEFAEFLEWKKSNV